MLLSRRLLCPGISSWTHQEGWTLLLLPHSGQGSLRPSPAPASPQTPQNLYFNPKSTLRSLSCHEGRDQNISRCHRQGGNIFISIFLVFLQNFAVFQDLWAGTECRWLCRIYPLLSSVAQPAPLLRDTFPHFSLDFSNAFHRKFLQWPLLPFCFLIFFPFW